MPTVSPRRLWKHLASRWGLKALGTFWVLTFMPGNPASTALGLTMVYTSSRRDLRVPTDSSSLGLRLCLAVSERHGGDTPGALKAPQGKEESLQGRGDQAPHWVPTAMWIFDHPRFRGHGGDPMGP